MPGLDQMDGASPTAVASGSGSVRQLKAWRLLWTVTRERLADSSKRLSGCSRSR
jgi:hypothetical protein